MCVCVKLLVKEAVAEQAQEKVAGLQELMEELERRVEEGKRERESLTAKWEQEMTALSSQVSRVCIVQTQTEPLT